MSLEFRLVLPRPEAVATEKYHSQCTTPQTRPTFYLCVRVTACKPPMSQQQTQSVRARMKVVMLSIARDFFSVCTRVESTFRKQISAPAFPLLTKNSYSRRPWNRHFYFGKMSLTHMAGSCFSDFFLLSAKFSLTDDCSFFNLFILGSIVEGTCRIRQIRVSFSRRESYREQQV